MSERVFDLCQIGDQGGTMAAPGSAAAATFKFPLNGKVNADLDRAAQYPVQDRGRNSRNAAGAGFYGVRGAGVTLPSDVHFEDLQDLAEAHWSKVSATGTGPYTRAYPFEVGTPTLSPKTIQLASADDSSYSGNRLISALIDSMTLSFADITAPGASPWQASCTWMALDRDNGAFTASQAVKAGLETALGHFTRLYEGATTTAFGSLSELAASLKSYSLTTNRNLRRRAYGGSTDSATKYGFGEQSNGQIEMKVGVSSTAKTDFHDAWNAAAPVALGEKRVRLTVAGTGTKAITIDHRIGMMAVPYDEADGERLFKVTGELVDDSTLDALALLTIVNSIA